LEYADPSEVTNAKGADAVAIDYTDFQPTSQTVLWEGSPSDLTSIAAAGRLTTAGYILTEDALKFASGVLSSREEQIPLWAVRDADVQQGLAQKARGVGDVRLALDQSNPFGQTSVLLKAIRDPRVVRDLIIRQANDVRKQWADHEHQRQLERAGAGAAHVVVGPTSTGGDDLLDRLSKLGEMKANGLLTDEEFAAAKAKLLG
jgi:hypothetical protein